MVTIDKVQLTINPYVEVIERAVYAMERVYDYAPRSFDISIADLSFVSNSGIVLKQAALLEPGQSTEEIMIQTATKLATNSEAREDLAKHIKSVVNALIVYVEGNFFSYEFKAQAHRHNDGCTIRVTFDTEYGDIGRMIAVRGNKGLYDEGSIDSGYDLGDVIWEIFGTVVKSAGFSTLDDNEAEFIKKVRDNDLIPGVNLSNLSDEEINEAAENSRLWNRASVYSFLQEHSGLRGVDFVKAVGRAAGSTAEFDLSELSFRFEYDIEIDEETFQSYFTIDSDEEHEAKLAARSKRDQIKANVDIVKPKVLAKLEEVLSDYDFDLEDLAEQIAECEDRVEVFDEIDDGDDDAFFSICDDFAEDSTYVVHARDGGCGRSLTGDRKDGHAYSLELGTYLTTGGYGYTFIILDGELIELDSDSFSISDAFDLLASAAHCSVLELPQRLVEKGYKDFDDTTLLSANDESQIYDWVENNVSASDIINIAEEEDLIESVVGEYDRTDDKFEIDFSDCFED